ncbi:MAG TPA: acyl-CoA dehydrogenase family protein [Chloroflexota bacterium]|nr:acyl-CoA dehydrogenase family protein [Chloroflexota bacterium]
MDFRLSAEQTAFQQRMRDFAARTLAPAATAVDRAGALAPGTVSALAAEGLLALAVPREYGGQARSALDYALVMEELAAACAATAVLVSVHNSLVADPIHHWGTAEQQARYLPRMATGACLGAFALTEPSAGSDAASLRTRASRDGAGYRLNGGKCFITNAGLAGIYLVFATLDPAAGPRGITAFLIEPGTPGFTIGAFEHKLGIRGSTTAQLYFGDCPVPATQRLGPEGQGWRVAMGTLDSGRIGIAAQALGIARAAYEAALAQTRDAAVAGGAVGEATQWLLADMSVRIDAARLLVHRAAALKDAGERLTREAAAAKLYAAETALWVTSQAVEMGGAAACALDSPLQRYLRDAKITEIYEGTSEIQRLIIGEQVLRQPAATPPQPAHAG